MNTKKDPSSNAFPDLKFHTAKTFDPNYNNANLIFIEDDVSLKSTINKWVVKNVFDTVDGFSIDKWRSMMTTFSERPSAVATFDSEFVESGDVAPVIAFEKGWKEFEIIRSRFNSVKDLGESMATLQNHAMLTVDRSYLHHDLARRDKEIFSIIRQDKQTADLAVCFLSCFVKSASEILEEVIGLKPNYDWKYKVSE